MDQLGWLAERFGGVVSSRQLGPELAKKVARDGEWTRLRAGWFAHASADQSVVSAVRAGGVLSCHSALARHGIWTPSHRIVHVRRSEAQQRRLGLRAATLRTCHPYRQWPATVSAVDGFGVAIASALNCGHAASSEAERIEQIVVVLDSALHQRRVSGGDVRSLLAASAYAGMDLASRCDPQSESGTETMVRLRLRSHGVKLQSQVAIADVGRVDFLVGARLVIEVDSVSYHLTKFQADRTRDRALVARGFLVMRVTYEDVVYRWPEVERQILDVVQRRQHGRLPQPSDAPS